jgi:sulfate transport system substrate-binding protein
MLTGTVGITIFWRMRTRTRLLLAALLALAVVAGACGSSSDDRDATGGGASGDGTTSLALVAYSAPKAGHDAASAAFAKTSGGAGVRIVGSYGASGDQSRAVVAGQKADVVHFSLEPDVTRLVDAGLVAPSWKSGPTKGIVSQSVVVLVVRKGNPKHLRGWEDLVRPGVQIVTPNPGSSGAARWNILAAWGHVIATGGSEADAQAYLTRLFEHTVALPGSARDATTAFTAGTGDVLISYENEAIFARQHGASVDYVVPDQSLLIENPGAVTVHAPAAATRYLRFLVSAQGQAAFASVGFRPLVTVRSLDVRGANDPKHPFPTVSHLLTIDHDFGGWASAGKRFFDPSTGIVTKIQQDTGKG